MRKLLFIESGFTCDLVGFQSFPLTTEEDIDMRLLEDLHGDVNLVFVGGPEARRLAELYGAEYIALDVAGG